MMPTAAFAWQTNRLLNHPESLRRIHGWRFCSVISFQGLVIYTLNVGSPELHGDAIRGSKLVANPGCYATSVILALAPFAKNELIDGNADIVCDCKSGACAQLCAPPAESIAAQ